MIGDIAFNSVFNIYHVVSNLLLLWSIAYFLWIAILRRFLHYLS